MPVDYAITYPSDNNYPCRTQQILKKIKLKFAVFRLLFESNHHENWLKGNGYIQTVQTDDRNVKTVKFASV